MTDSVRIKFMIQSVDSGNGIRVSVIDSVCFLGKESITKLPLVKVNGLTNAAHYAPLKIEMIHDNPNSTIFYTTNGDIPNPFNAEIYKDSINIKRTTTIQCMAYQTGYESSDILTETIYFGHIDTLYHINEVNAIDQSMRDRYFHFLCDLPITHQSNNLTYFTNGETSFRFLGDINHQFFNGDCINSCIVKANHTRNETYFEPIWIESFYSSTPITPELTDIALINEKSINKYIKLESITLSNNIVFSNQSEYHDTIYAVNISNDSIPLKNVLGCMDGLYSNFLRYNIIGIIAHYGGKIHLYPITIIPSTNSESENIYYEKMIWNRNDL